MAGRIPQQFIDDLMSRVDIVDVIDQRVPLKKAGREYTACCPFHDEKTPSFTVSPQKQFYHCFGCGAHGTALGFLMEYEHLDFVEAVRQLAASQGMELPQGGDEPRGPSRQPLYELMEQAAQFYQQQLRQHPQRQRAVDYLKGRGLSGEIARDYSIGYAPEGWDNLQQQMGRDTPTQRQLIECGMLIEKESGRSYDRFRDRIMFPIRDARGRVIAFGGRVLDSEAKGAKYLNSPETPIFHKGRELYGLYEARQALRQIPRLLVVEGYMDVVALAQFGIRYAVATLGTAVTKEHLERLFRVAPEVVFCFDGDRAGRDAAWRGLENGLPLMREGHQLRFMFLPEGEDPDTLVRTIGREGFEQAVESAVPLSDYFFERLGQQTEMSSLDGRARLVELARPYLAKLPNGAFKELMTDALARQARMEPARLQVLLRGKTPPPGPRPRGDKGGTKRKSPPSPLRHAISLLLHQPTLAQQVAAARELALPEVPGKALLVEILELLHQHPHLSSGALLEHWREHEYGPHLVALARQALPLDEGVRLEDEFVGALALLEKQQRQQRREALLAKGLEALSEAERAELGELFKDEAPGADKP